MSSDTLIDQKAADEARLAARDIHDAVIDGLNGGSAANNAVDDIADSTKGAIGSVNAKIRNARVAAGDMADEALDVLDTAAEPVRDYIRTYPVQAIAMAVGATVLISRISRLLGGR